MDYQHGKIYKVLNNVDDDCYVGSTTQPLSKRMASHRKCMNCVAKRDRILYTKMRDLGVGNFYIELIEEYPCDNVEQLRKREGYFIRELGTLNHVVAGRSKSEWTVENIEHVKGHSKANHEANRDKRLKLMSEYRATHKGDIKICKYE